MKEMKVITFLNNKGGVGKSASISAVAHILASVYGKKVLMVDLDPQANISQLFGYDVSLEEYSLKELLQGKVYPAQDTVEDILKDKEKDIHECIVQTEFENLALIPSYITLSNVENLLIANVHEPQQFRLDGQLRKVRGEYDYCLIDCGPSLSLLTINALAASNEVYIPSKCDRNSRVGIANVLRMVKSVQSFSRNDLRFGGCFLTQYDERKKICKEAWEDCREALGEKLLSVTIPTDTKVEQTTSCNKPVYLLGKNGRAAQSYLELTKVILKEDSQK